MIDFFYPPFRKIMPQQIFRYGACGVSNVMFDWVVYFIVYNFILKHQMLHLGFVTLSSYIAAYVFTFPITIVTGFLLQKFVTFTNTGLQARVQLVRYLLVGVLNITLNYAGLKLLVEYFGIYPTPAKMIMTVFAAGFSYFCQTKFTFRSSISHPKDKHKMMGVQ